MTTFAGRYDEPILDRFGNGRAGLSCTVYISGTTTLATLYDARDKSGFLSNPIETDGVGNLSFYADPAEYTISATVDGSPFTRDINIPPDAGDLDLAVTTAVDAHVAAVDPHAGYQKESEKGVANGYPSLDSGGTVPDAQIPSTVARDAEVTAAISSHEGGADPHSQYIDKTGTITTTSPVLTPSATNQVALALKWLASQSVPVFRILNNLDTVVFSVGRSGSVADATLVGDIYVEGQLDVESNIYVVAWNTPSVPGIELDNRVSGDGKSTISFSQGGSGEWEIITDDLNSGGHDFQIYDEVSGFPVFFVEENGNISLLRRIDSTDYGDGVRVIRIHECASTPSSAPPDEAALLFAHEGHLKSMGRSAELVRLDMPWMPMRSGLWYASLTDDVTGETPAGDVLRCSPIFISRALTIDKIGVNVLTVGAAGSVIRLGIYKDISDSAVPGAAGYPGDLVLDAGTVTGTTLGERSIDIDQYVEPGLYWLASDFQGSPATQPTVSGGGMLSGLVGLTDIGGLNSEIGGFRTDSVAGALPATFSTTVVNTSTKPRVAIKIA